MAVCHYSELRIMSINKKTCLKIHLNLSIVVTQHRTELGRKGERIFHNKHSRRNSFPAFVFYNKQNHNRLIQLSYGIHKGIGP